MSEPDSPPNNAQSYSSRNPRRRQRKESEEGGSLRQQPLRKRSKLSKNSFEPHAVATTNGSSDNVHHMNGHLSLSERDQSPLSQDIPVRERRTGPPARRATKDDGAVILTQNPNYVVKQLPGLPSQLRNVSSGPVAYRGYFVPSNGYALALTAEEAIIWDASSTTTSPPTRSFSLPHPSKGKDPLPIGALVTAGSGREVGLVVVAPVSGKITFWENIENADALSLFAQRRNGIEGSISGLFSGEVVTGIDAVEHAGFVLIFSTGRTAQLILRDSQSRPTVMTSFLRSNNTVTGGGLFGGLRNMFGGGGWLKDAIATKSRPSQQRGHMEVLVSDKAANFQLWELSWSGQAILKTEFDAADEIERSLKSAMTSASGDEFFEMQVLDFVFASDHRQPSKSVISNHEDPSIDLVVLTAVVGSSSSCLALVEMDGTPSEPNARRTTLLRSYIAPLVSKSNWRPKLCLPGPYHTAFVVLEQAIVIVSVSTHPTGPESSLDELPEPFQDAIYLRDIDDLYVVGADIEDDNDLKRKHSAISVFVRSFGVIRIIAHEPGPTHANSRARITAKSKIEQAIFYGTRASNPLNLAEKPVKGFSIEEVEQAALDVSREILDSSSDLTSPTSQSTEKQLEQRMQMLEKLAMHIKHNYPSLSRVGKWRLRWDAEKMAAAHQIWLNLGSRLNEKTAGEVLVLPSLIKFLHERYKTPRDTNAGERDPVRHYFAKDVWRIELIIPWAYETIRQLSDPAGDNIRDRKQLLSLASQAGDLVLGGLETAFAFRAANAHLYGLESEDLKNGVLQSGYEDLPQFWTSSKNVIDRNMLLVDLARELAWQYFEKSEGDTMVHQLSQKVAQDNVRLVKICCQCYDEGQRWCVAQNGEESQALGRHLEEEFRKQRFTMLTGLPKIGMVRPGFEVAERYHDMDSLVFLVAEEADYLHGILRERGVDQETADFARLQLIELEKRVSLYFERFGIKWRDTYFSKQLQDGRYASLLDHASQFKPQVTGFLRASERRAKLSWINDIVSERDYMSAGEVLVDNAAQTESSLWCKKIELSIAKLSLLAAKETNPASQGIKEDEQKRKSAVQLIRIQEKVFQHVGPSIYDAMDDTAELQLAMESFGRYATDGQPALQQLLERALESLLKRSAMSVDQLIDLLTLMDSRTSDLKIDNLAGKEFSLALEVLRYSGLHQTDHARHEMLLKIIWRRCLLRDDWESLDDTSKKSDPEIQEDVAPTMMFKTLYEGYVQDLWAQGSTVQPPTPEVCLEAGTKQEDHEYRFPSRDLRAPIARDMAAEAKRLLQLIQRHRMVFWFDSCKTWSEALYKANEEAAAELGQKTQKVKEDIHNEDADLRRGGEPVESSQRELVE